MISDTLAEPRSLNQIGAWTDLTVGQIQVELTQLENRGSIQRKGGLFVRRKGERTTVS